VARAAARIGVAAAVLIAAAPARGDRMESIIIPETTVWRTGDWKVAVSHVIRGKYRDAKGAEREGDKASLVIVRKGAKPGESEVHVEVGAGSELKLGDATWDVVRVSNPPGGEGAVELRPRP
jgi:hypothetical protein